MTMQGKYLLIRFLLLAFLLSSLSGCGQSTPGTTNTDTQALKPLTVAMQERQDESSGNGFVPLDPSDRDAQLDAAFLSYQPMPTPVLDAPPLQGALGDDGLVTVEHVLPFLESSPTGPGEILPLYSVGNKGVSPGKREETAIADRPEIIIGSDGRFLITDTMVWPWRPQCKLYIQFPNQNYTCSGTVLRNRHVLTAAHCVYLKKEGGWATSVTVVPGQNGSYKPYGSYTAAGTKIKTFAAWTNNADYRGDLALIEVNGDIGNRVGWLGFAYYPSINWMVNVSSYPGDKDNGMKQWCGSGAASDYSAQIFRHKADIMPGSSGAAVYEIDNGKRYALGVVSHSQNGDQSYNYATKIDKDKFNTLKSWLGL